MNVQLLPARYVVAVSGGVDSIVLLHLLQQKPRPSFRLTVAHFDHGIREGSREDRLFVQHLAGHYDLPFVFDRAELGAGVSEEKARLARYDFLRRVRQASGARAIVTAHHQDDMLETALLNMVRGTGRKGLTSLTDHGNLLRPLLEYSKQDIYDYAKEQGLTWREDSTNGDDRFTRNYLRHHIVPKMTDNERKQLIAHILDQRVINAELDSLLINQLHMQTRKKELDRNYFNGLPHAVAREVLASWLRAHGIRSFDARTLDRLVITAKTAHAGKRLATTSNRYILVGKHSLALSISER